MIRNALAAAFAAAAILLCTSCSSDSGVSNASRRAQPDPSWTSAISLHTNGAMSRHAPIRVLFINDIIPETRVGTDASANIVIKPAVDATAVFVTRREILLRPERPLEPNTEYRIAVLPKGLTGLASDIKPFEFSITTLEVNFEVTVGALSLEPGKNELMTLHGYIGTADSEPREKLEKILTATLDDKPIPIQWQGGDRSYSFVIQNIQRKQHEQELTLHWDGRPLGVDKQGEKSTRVPALDEFAVTKAEAIEEDEQRQVQLHFSDALDTRQDLKGLVRLSEGEFTTRIENNVLTL